MPELPEVETVCRQLRTDLSSSDKIKRVQMNRPDLRWPMPEDLSKLLVQQSVQTVTRRGKYILFHLPKGRLLSHLGMSGSWRLQSTAEEIRKHDHVVIEFTSGRRLVFHDPRRFGMIDWMPLGSEHKLLKSLGPEPLSNAFNAEYIWKKTRKRSVPIKLWLMNNQNVVGIGNIYASEILFRARISPFRKTNKIKHDEIPKLIESVREVLLEAIDAGGSSIRDYVSSKGEQGNFQDCHDVYGRKNKLCFVCNSKIQVRVQGSRSTYWCKVCQV